MKWPVQPDRKELIKLPVIVSHNAYLKKTKNGNSPSSMETRNKIFFLPLFRVVHFVFFILLWNSLVNLKFIKNKFLKRNSFLFQKPIFIYFY
jgi:hypothetical protein